jgi:hypothetical protein
VIGMSNDDASPVAPDELTARDEHRDAHRHEHRDDLIDRVRLVEDQPLADRATSYAQLHDELRTRLESGGATGSDTNGGRAGA